ncbi:MAG: hypothetical protein WAN04_10750 [Candidatus Udaeobacter sp.]
MGAAVLYRRSCPLEDLVQEQSIELFVINSSADIEIIARFGARGYRGEDNAITANFMSLRLFAEFTWQS